MSITKAKKEAVLKDLTASLGGVQAAIFTDFTGVDVAGITALRAKLRAEGARYIVAKRTLVERALPAHQAVKVEIELSKLAGFPVPDWFETLLAGSTGIAFVDAEPIAVARVLVDFRKEYNKFGIKGGLLAGEFIRGDQVTALALAPPREVLLSRVLGAMLAPHGQFVGVLAAIMRKAVGTIQAIADKKKEEETTS